MALHDGAALVQLGYTQSMKTAISIPDRLFDAADQLARRLGMSRSELYARAIATYLAQESDQDVTERLDAVYAEVESRMDPLVTAAQRRAVG